jgi:hypothetical protein
MMLSRNEGIIYQSQSLIFQQSGYRKIGKSGIGGFVGMAHGTAANSRRPDYQ